MDGVQLRDLIRSRGLTAAGVATRIGVTKNTVTNWSVGNTRLVPKHLPALADLLGVTIDELAGRAPKHSGDEERALLVLGRLLESAGAVRAISQAAPNLLDVLREAEETVKRHGEPVERPPLGSPRGRRG
jgi:transcriptional regulator with XRE-family HTH domain